MNRRNFVRNMALASLAVTTVGDRSLLAVNAPFASEMHNTAKVPFQISVMLWTVFRDLPFEQRLEKVAQAGYTNVELVGEYETWSSDDFDRANAARKKLGITFDATAGLKHGLANPADRDNMLADLHNALIAMEKLDCSSVILLSGNVVPGLTREAQHRSCVDGLRAAAGLAQGKTIAGRPVQLLLETIDPEENPLYFLTSANEALDVVRSVHHPQVKFLYDFFHEQIAEGNLIEKLEKHIKDIALVHIADVPGRHEPGTGEINYESIFRKLGELNYDGMVAMEFHPTGDPVSQLRAAREMAMQYGSKGKA